LNFHFFRGNPRTPATGVSAPDPGEGRGGKGRKEGGKAGEGEGRGGKGEGGWKGRGEVCIVAVGGIDAPDLT